MYYAIVSYPTRAMSVRYFGHDGNFGMQWTYYPAEDVAPDFSQYEIGTQDSVLGIEFCGKNCQPPNLQMTND